MKARQQADSPREDSQRETPPNKFFFLFFFFFFFFFLFLCWVLGLVHTFFSLQGGVVVQPGWFAQPTWVVITAGFY